MSTARRRRTTELTGELDELVSKAAENDAFLEDTLEILNGDRRAQRILAARVVAGVAAASPASLKHHAEPLAEALDKPEAQTRWEVLGALEAMVGTDARLVDKALPEITTALHDADSGVVRLAAFKVLCAYAATTPTRSERVWPLIDEGIRVYHGDPEFTAMLSAVIRLVTGNASDEVKLAAAETMSFDAEHSKGIVAKRAKAIVDAAPKRRKRKKTS